MTTSHITGIPREASPIFDALMASAPRSAEHLRADLDRWRQKLDQVELEHEFFDRVFADQLLVVANALLSVLVTDPLPTAQASAISAAIGYLLKSDDGEHDFASLIGLDDDAEVLRAVAHFIGRPDLAASIPL